MDTTIALVYSNLFLCWCISKTRLNRLVIYWSTCKLVQTGLHLFKNLLLSTSHSPPRKSDFSTPVAGLHLFKNLLLSTHHSPPRKSDFSTPVAGLHLFKNLLLSAYHTPPRKNEFLHPSGRASSKFLYI